MGKVIGKCPLCGGDIYVTEVYETRYVHEIDKDGNYGEIGEPDYGEIVDSYADCGSCEENWFENEFMIKDGKFIDLKNREE